MTYGQRITLLAVLDSLIIFSAIYLSTILVFASFDFIPTQLVISGVILLLCHYFFSYKYKLYKKAWEYASIKELMFILKAITFSIIVLGLTQQLFMDTFQVRQLAVIWLLQMFLIGGSRFLWRVFRDSYITSRTKKRTLIIGAGSAGTMIVRQLLKSEDSDLEPVAFIDDNVKKQHLDILGIPVVGGISDIQQTVERYDIENIVIAIPSLSKKELNTIFQECAHTNAKTQILPMLEDLVTGKVSVSQFRDVEVSDLLGREPVELDIDSISEGIAGKTVLVTGAGGSIGSEICRQIAMFNPKQLILLGRGENSIYTIELELKENFKHTSIDFIPVIADLKDASKMIAVVMKYQPEVIYHAAAHKHVPLMEVNPDEAVKNNIIGTINIANAARLNGINTFVMISSDKAVNPTSVMGATKRIAEMMIQEMDQSSKTKFVAVRFGNVLGSRGSVIPLFKKQIQKGGPVTVTHPDMVRFFMTIPEASKLVIQAGALAKGGEIFVLDMGEPIRITDLAKNLIKLSGHSVEEIGINYSGIRPGEKLYEELLNQNELNEKQIYPKIYIGKTSEIYLEEIEDIISNFEEMDSQELKQKLLALTNRNPIKHPLAIKSG